MKDAKIKAAREVTLGPATPETLKHLLSPQTVTVQFKAGTKADDIDEHIELVHSWADTFAKTEKNKETYAGILIELQAVFQGYIGIFHPIVLSKIKVAEIVSVVEENIFLRQLAFEIIPSRYWGASRISLNETQFKANPKPQSDTFKIGNIKGKEPVWEYNAQALGEGVSIYIIDSQGFANTDFTRDTSRIEFSDLNTLDPDSTENHATVVANIAAGQTLGIAPKAKVWLQASPESTTRHAWITVGMERIIKEHEKRKTPALLNMSFGEVYDLTGVYASRLLQTAIQAVISKGIIVVCAAGNDANFIDGANKFPQMIPDVIMVGASDKENHLARAFSNYGPRVDIYAPGTETPVLASSFGLSSNQQAGTSFAAPTVTGFLACLFSENLKTDKTWKVPSPAEIKRMLREEYSQITDSYDYDGKRHSVRTLVAKSLANQSLKIPEPYIEFMEVKRTPLGDKGYYFVSFPPHGVEFNWPADKFKKMVEAMSKQNKPEYERLFKELTTTQKDEVSPLPPKGKVAPPPEERPKIEQDIWKIFGATKRVIVRYPLVPKQTAAPRRSYPENEGTLDKGIIGDEIQKVALWLLTRLEELK